MTPYTYVQIETITIEETAMLIKHHKNMRRVIQNRLYDHIAQGDLTPFKIEMNRIEQYLKRVRYNNSECIDYLMKLGYGDD